MASLLKNVNEESLNRTKERMIVASKIADELERQGLTQKEFAERMGKSPSEISDWLSGDRNFTIDTLADIKRVLGINLINTQKETTFITIPSEPINEKISISKTITCLNSLGIRKEYKRSKKGVSSSLVTA